MTLFTILPKEYVSNVVFPSIPTHRQMKLQDLLNYWSHYQISSGNDVIALAIQSFLGCNKIPELLW